MVSSSFDERSEETELSHNTLKEQAKKYIGVSRTRVTSVVAIPKSKKAWTCSEESVHLTSRRGNSFSSHLEWAQKRCKSRGNGSTGIPFATSFSCRTQEIFCCGEVALSPRNPLYRSSVNQPMKSTKWASATGMIEQSSFSKKAFPVFHCVSLFVTVRLLPPCYSSSRAPLA